MHRISPLLHDFTLLKIFLFVLLSVLTTPLLFNYVDGCFMVLRKLNKCCLWVNTPSDVETYFSLNRTIFNLIFTQCIFTVVNQNDYLISLTLPLTYSVMTSLGLRYITDDFEILFLLQHHLLLQCQCFPYRNYGEILFLRKDLKNSIDPFNILNLIFQTVSFAIFLETLHTFHWRLCCVFIYIVFTCKFANEIDVWF